MSDLQPADRAATDDAPTAADGARDAAPAVPAEPVRADGASHARTAGLLLGGLALAHVVAAGVLLATGHGAVVLAAAGFDVALAVLAGGAALLLVPALRSLAEQTTTARRAADALRVNDALTNVLNRRGLELMAAPMIELARRRGEAVHALFVDVDGFAAVNDELGWDRGDDVLVAVAEALLGSCRQTDVVCRVGGDEFVVVGPGTGTSPLELERRMREILRAAPPVDGSVWPSSLSIGSATLVPWDDGDLASLLGRADSDMRLRRSLRRQSQDRRTRDTSPREV